MKRDKVSMGGGFLVPKRYKTVVHMCMWKEGEKHFLCKLGLDKDFNIMLRIKVDFSLYANLIGRNKLPPPPQTNPSTMLFWYISRYLV